MDLKFYAKAKTAQLFSWKKFASFLIITVLSASTINAQTGNALGFDGVDDSVSVANHPSLNITSTITIEAWVNYSKNTGVQNVVSKSSRNVNNSYIFPRTADGWRTVEFKLRFNAAIDFTTLKVDYSTITHRYRNQWHHLAATYDGYFMRIYIDGVLAGTQAAAGAITANNNRLLLGAQTGYTNENYGGKVDDIRIWNRALTGCEISANRSCQLTGNESGLAAYYKLNQGLANLPNLLETTVYDATPNNNNGVLTSAFLLTGLSSNWTDGTVSTAGCPAFVPVSATAGAQATILAVGSTINLTASGGDTYSWTGPNGFTSTEQNPSIPSAGILASGTYTVVATRNGCSGSASVVISVAYPAKALHFDGQDGNIRIPNSASFNNGSALTIESWVYPTSNLPLVQTILSKSNAATNNGFIFPRTDDGWQTYSFWLAVNGQWKVVSAPFPGRNQWTHVAATYDGYFMKIYMNGVLTASLSAQGTITLNTNDVTLGRQDGYTEYYKGGMDELRIWGRALTECEIANNHACQLNGDNNGLASLSNLSAYYRFNQGLINVDNAPYTTLVDSSGNNNNGTLLNFELTGLSSNWIAGGAVNDFTCTPYQASLPTATSNGPVVEFGTNIELHASDGTAWAWTGPLGFTSTQQHPVIPNSVLGRSGTYTVQITGNGCSSTASTQIKVAYRAGSLHFDGVNDQVNVPNAPSLNISKEITLEAWIKPSNSTRQVQDVISKSSKDINVGYIFPRTDDGWQSYTFYLHINGMWETLTAPYPSLNTWQHLAATYDGYYMRIYLNGVLSAAKVIQNGGDIAINANDLVLGRQPGLDEFFEGNVEEARVWDRALSQCEIINNMNCEVGQLQNSGLAAYYKFNQGFVDANNSALTTVTDFSANGNTGTLANFTLDGLTSNWSESKISGTCSTYAKPPVAANANGTQFSVGSSIILYGSGGFTYSWDGPNGYTANGATAYVNNVQLNSTGVYTVTAPFVNCVITASTRLTVSLLNPLTVNGPTTFCPSGSVTITSPNTGTAYQWFRNGVAINGATSVSYVATLDGSYTISVTRGVDVLVSEPVTVSVQDNLAPQPSVTPLPVINVYTDVAITGAPVAVDNCTGNVTGTTQSPLTYAVPGTYTLTWVYNDGNGNTSTQSQTVVVTKAPDVTPPVITVPANITRNNDPGLCGAAVTFAATATDESPVTISYSSTPGIWFPVGTTTVTVTAVDANGNTATATFTITIVDVTAPTLTAPQNISSATGNNINIGTATATDNCGTPVVSHSAVPAVFPMGVTNITWTATDAAGNVTTKIQTVTVQDNIAPVLVGVPANTSVTCGVLPAVPNVTATDNVAGTLTVTMTQSTNGNIVTRTWSVTDAAGNTTTASQQITLIPDTQVPVMTGPPNVTATSGTGINIGTATATDNCSTPVITHSAVPAVFSLGVTNITWYAKDAAGNTATGIQTVTVTDVTAPVMSGVPANTTAACGVVPAVPTVTATDNFDTNPVVTMVETTSGNTITRTWTARDASGNTSTATQVITIVSSAAPVITGPTSGTTVTMNPVATALDFNVFAQNGVTFGNGQSHGPVALGGDLTLSGGYSVSNNSAGTFKVSNVPVTLLMGGKVVYQGGNGINVNQNGYVKIGNNTGSYVWYKDQNNAFSPIRITPGNNYNGSPRINLQANSQQLAVSATSNPVFEGGLIDFATAFNQLKSTAASLSAITDNANLTNPNGGTIPHTSLPTQVKINLANGVNVLNINASDLNNVQNFTYNNQPDASRILIINVNAPGSFNWNVWNSGGIGDQNTKYILYNFYNTTALTVQGNGSVMGTLFAPYATINKASSQNITGQIVGQTFVHTSGTNTYNKFEGTVTSGSTTVIAQNSNNTRATNNANCKYTISGSEFNITAVAGDNCGSGVVTLSYALTGATTGTGSSLAGVALNPGTTTVTWTATSGNSTSTYVFNVTVQANIPAAPSVNVVSNCGNTILSTTATGSLAWSNGATGSSTTVTSNGTYSVTATVNGCASAATATAVTIATAPSVAQIAGNTTVTAGSNTQLTNSTTGGSWSSNNSGVATVNASGLVSGISAGTAVISYTVTTPAGCSTVVTANVTVNPNCVVPVVTAANVVANTASTSTNCTSAVTYTANVTGTPAATITYTLSGATTGSGNGTGSGVVFNTGVTTVVVKAVNSCGTASATFTVTLKDATAPVPTVASLPAITGQCSATLVTASSGNNNNNNNNCSYNNDDYRYRGIVSLILYYLNGYYNWSNDDHNHDYNCGGNNNNNSGSQTVSAPTATDNCKGTITGTTTDPLTYTTQGTYTINWKFDDGNGNVTIQPQTVIVKDDVKPVISTPNNITVSCGSSTTPSGCNSNATATDNCSSVNVTYSDVTNGNVITRTWKATDAAGNFSTGTQTITLVDNTKPNISDVSDVTVGCSAATTPSATGTATATDNCSAVVVTYSDVTSGNVITRTWKATDAAGNTNTSTQKITKGSSFSVNVSSVPTSNTYTGGVSTNLYLGYGAQSTKLQVCDLPSSGAPYTYSWSGSATSRLNSTSSSAPTFTPNTTGSSTFVVTVTNKYGCTSTDYISICVTDIRVPGTNGNKVYVCHKTSSRWNTSYQTLQVSVNAVSGHLNHGGCGNDDDDDRLGSCDQTPCNTTSVNTVSTSKTQGITAEGGSTVVTNNTGNKSAVTTEEELKVTVMPNPSTTFFTLKFESKYETPLDLRVMDANGRVVDAKSKLGANSTLQIGHNYTSGTYFAEISQNGKRKVIQLIKLRG